MAPTGLGSGRLRLRRRLLQPLKESSRSWSDAPRAPWVPLTRPSRSSRRSRPSSIPSRRCETLRTRRVSRSRSLADGRFSAPIATSCARIARSRVSNAADSAPDTTGFSSSSCASLPIASSPWRVTRPLKLSSLMAWTLQLLGRSRPMARRPTGRSEPNREADVDTRMQAWFLEGGAGWHLPSSLLLHPSSERKAKLRRDPVPDCNAPDQSVASVRASQGAVRYSIGVRTDMMVRGEGRS